MEPTGNPSDTEEACSWANSDFPALLLGRMLVCLSTQRITSNGGEGRFFPALVTRIVDGDTVRLVRVLADEQVKEYMDMKERLSLRQITEAVTKPTETIIDCPTLPDVQLPTWTDGQHHGSMDRCSILARLYGIDAPEVVSGGMIKLKGEVYKDEDLKNLEYGSQHLDRKGQPLGIAAGRALSELLLGRVVLVQDLGEDCHRRLVARILIPAVTDRQLDGDLAYDNYFSSFLKNMQDLLPPDVSIPQSKRTGAEAVAALANALRDSQYTNDQVRVMLFEGLRKARREPPQIPGLFDASDEMLRRGLALVCEGKHIQYAGRREELDRLAALAESESCGRWALSSNCRIDPYIFRSGRRGCRQQQIACKAKGDTKLRVDDDNDDAVLPYSREVHAEALGNAPGRGTADEPLPPNSQQKEYFASSSSPIWSSRAANDAESTSREVHGEALGNAPGRGTAEESWSSQWKGCCSSLFPDWSSRSGTKQASDGSSCDLWSAFLDAVSNVYFGVRTVWSFDCCFPLFGESSK